VYLTPRELVKFGQLYVDNGLWEDEPLVPAAWVDDSMDAHIDAGQDYSYGYLFWITQIAGHNVALAWGWGGQLIYIVPDLDVVVVFTTNTRDYAPDFDGYEILHDYVIPAAGL
jgi:CubicO group peptidase (beta-lactamase class C family)